MDRLAVAYAMRHVDRENMTLLGSHATWLTEKFCDKRDYRKTARHTISCGIEIFRVLSREEKAGSAPSKFGSICRGHV